MNEAARRRHIRPGRRAACLAACLLLGLGACTVGPDFARPDAPSAQSYTTGTMPSEITSSTGEAEQRVRLGKEISAEWWSLFRSPALSAVVAEAIQGSKTITAARATLAQAQQNVIAAKGGLYPQVDLSASAQRERQPGQSGSGARYSNFYSVGPSVEFSLDVFGGTRRGIEQQQALAELQRYELGAAYLALTGNAVLSAIDIASLRAHIQVAEDIIASDQQNLSLVQQSFEAGKVARTDVLTAETQLGTDQTVLPPLNQQLAAARDGLAVLVGRAPAEWSAPEFDLKEFTLPADLPLSLPSALARQRPDILAAEAQLHADSAAIGVATAQLYPNITLSASLAQQAISPSPLFTAVSTFWSLAAGLTQPIFHGGTLEAERKAAIDAYQASLATYEQTVLQGLQQVADNLLALAHDAELVDAERRVLDTASTSLTLQRESYAAGKSDLLRLLDAQRSYHQARQGYVLAQAQRLQDTAGLFTALGGGWWQRNL
jgi:NodT family efflux transporter outer membrane factor (OMF) lipoprotein